MASPDSMNQFAAEGGNPLDQFLGFLGSVLDAATSPPPASTPPASTPPASPPSGGAPSGWSWKPGRPGFFDPLAPKVPPKAPPFNPIAVPGAWTPGQKIAAGVGLALLIGLGVAASK